VKGRSGRDPRLFWIEFYKANYSDVHRFIRRNLWGSRADSEDLTQSVFIRMMKNIDRYPTDGVELRKLAFKIAFNICRDEPGRARKGREVLTEEQIESFSDLDIGSSIAEALRVHEVLAQMSEREHRVLDLRGQGFSFREIAELLDLKDEDAARYQFNVAGTKFSRLYQDERP
jgi:RNA polymerase sigma factor (sigma-70 family)